MTQAGPLEWASGDGWLVLVGDSDWRRWEATEIGDRILALADFSRPPVYLPAVGGSTEEGEALLDYLAGLGGPRGYVLSLFSAGDAWLDENSRLLAEAGVILLGDGDALAIAGALRRTPALEGVARAFLQGALVAGLGGGAAALGEWVVVEGGGGGEGWGWVGCVVVPRFVGASHSPALRAALRARPGSVGLGLPADTALALGPAGQVETWGEGEVTVVLSSS